MDAIYDCESPPGTDKVMLVMLPGATHKPADFAHHGFIQALRRRKLPVDTALVDAHLGCYLERSLVKSLTEDVITPARARGYKRIWLMGISLGGMGALTYAREHPGEIAGVVVLAPFLGVRGTIEEIVRAGGIDQWQPGTIAPQDDERHLLAWLKTYEAANPAWPAIHLGYGTGDRFIAASAILGNRLPPARIATAPGGHDWKTWSTLWEKLLDRDLFVCESEHRNTQRVKR
ncbi:MAG TPA: alpha/beta fold hydrolase [Burkholderiales bacterium]|nr:alpha/beta fold hydrolase [Burkholderiales bacterium]